MTHIPGPHNYDHGTIFAGGRSVARMDFGEHWKDESLQATGKLYAAASDLLELAQRVAHGGNWFEGQGEIQAWARDVITKATNDS